MLKTLTFFNTKESIETNTVSSANYTISDPQTPPYSFQYHSAEFAKSPPKTEVLPPVTLNSLSQTSPHKPTGSCPAPLPEVSVLCKAGEEKRGQLCVEETTCQPAPPGTGTAWPLVRESEGRAPLPLTDQKQARQFPTKLMVLEHFKLSPKPSSIRNMEPFSCHHTGEQEVTGKRLGCHSSAVLANPIPRFTTFLFSRGMGSRRQCNRQVVLNYSHFSSGQLPVFETLC